MYLFYHELIHVFFSFVSAYVTYLIFQKKERNRKKLIFVTLAGGLLGALFVDMDHLVDYFLAYGLNFHPFYFLKGYMFNKLQKTFVPFHGWEWVLLLQIAAKFVKNKKIKYFFVSLSVGLFTHLVVDMYLNNITFLGYSFFYRLFHSFDLKSVTN